VPRPQTMLGEYLPSTWTTTSPQMPPNTAENGTSSPKLTLVDSHCHLGFLDFAGELDAVVARARAAGIARIVTISTRGQAARWSTSPSPSVLPRLWFGRHYPYHAATRANVWAPPLRRHGGPEHRREH
jgi:TatD related DNase